MASKGSPLHGPQVRLVEQAHRLFAETKEHLFESKSAEEHAKLLRYEIIYQTTLRFEDTIASLFGQSYTIWLLASCNIHK